MKILLRIAGVLVVLLSLLGVIACGVGIYYIWRFHQSAPPEAQVLAERIESGFERATLTIQTVQRGLEQALASVEAVNRESGKLKGSPSFTRRVKSSAIRNLVVQHVDPDVNALSNRLVILSDSAVAISALLQSFRELPESHTGRITPGQLEGWSDQADRLSSALQNLHGMVGTPNREISDEELVAASSVVADALQRCQEKVDAWKAVLGSAHEDFRQVRTQAARWFFPAAVALTVVCVWVALGQISLFLHALGWCMVQSSSNRTALIKN